MRSSAQMFSTVALALAAFLATGCSTNARRVDCEWRLEPINRPAQKRAEPPSTTVPETVRGDR